MMYVEKYVAECHLGTFIFADSPDWQYRWPYGTSRARILSAAWAWDALEFA